MHARGALPVSYSVLLDLKSHSCAGNVQVNHKEISIYLSKYSFR